MDTTVSHHNSEIELSLTRLAPNFSDVCNISFELSSFTRVAMDITLIVAMIREANPVTGYRAFLSLLSSLT